MTPRPPRPGGHHTGGSHRAPPGSGGRSGSGGGAGRGPRPERGTGERSLADRGLGGAQVEGRRAVRELLVAGRRRVRDLWISETVEEGPLVVEILALAEDIGVPIRRVPRGRLDAEAQTASPQGILAHAEPVEGVSLDDLCTRPSGAPPPFLLVLDSVTDPQNLGALLRTADVAGATGAVLPRHRAAHLTPSVVKAAAGAVEHLRLAVVPGIPAALRVLHDRGIWTVGLDADAEQPVWDLPLATEPLALVVGSEGSGLSRLTRARCDVVVSIPQHGRLGSLNVAAAGAIAAFEVARRRT